MIKKQLLYILLIVVITNVFTSCDTEGEYEVKDTFVTLGFKFEYFVNDNAQYRIDFGNQRLTKTSPFDSKEKIEIVSGKVYIKEKDLKQDLKIWRLGADGTETLESITSIQAEANDFISLLQLTDNKPVTVFKPELPKSDQPTQTNVQFFYGNELQPETIKVSILAVDYFFFLTDENVNYTFENLPTNKKKEIANFTLSKGVLSEIINLDLNLFNDENNVGTAFFYEITNAATGTIIQNYEDSSKSKIEVDLKLGEGVLTKYKFSLLQWDYVRSSIPFKINTLKSFEKW